MHNTGSPARNWAGNIEFRAERVHRPESVGELRRLVAASSRVRALGTGHSFNRIADTDGDLVRLDGLPRTAVLDGPSVTVGAGMRYGELAAVLHEAGRALPNMASLPHISVAGCCATGTHGSGDRQRGLAASVSSVEFVDARGELVVLSRDNDPERFPGAVVALGALGIVTHLTLDTEPAFEVSQRVYTGVTLDTVAARFDEIFSAAYSVSVFTDWDSGTARIWLKERTGAAGQGRAGDAWLGGQVSPVAQHPIPGIPAPHCTEQLGVPGPWHERLPHFRPDFTPSNGTELQSELFLPRAAAPEACEALRSVGGLLRPVLQTSEIRTVAADGMWLSPAYGRDSVAFHFTWTEDTAAVLAAVAAVEARLAPLGARPHWGKVTTMQPEHIVSLYERARDFRDLLGTYDPEGVFRNDYLDALFPPQPRSG